MTSPRRFNLLQDRGIEKRFMNRCARQGVCCVALVRPIWQDLGDPTAVLGRVDCGWECAGPSGFVLIRPSPAACPAHRMNHSGGLSVPAQLVDEQGPVLRISQI